MFFHGKQEKQESFTEPREVEPEVPENVEAQEATRASILEEALGYVTSDRSSSYGEPEDNFDTIAKFWRTYLQRRFGYDVPVEAIDVSPMMLLLKISRMAATPAHHDSYVDGAGYSATGGEIAARVREQERRHDIEAAEHISDALKYVSGGWVERELDREEANRKLSEETLREKYGGYHG